MARQAIPLTYTFVNPNAPAEVERLLQKIVIEKLLSEHRQRTAEAC